MQTWRSNLKSLSILPVPSTTDARGSSAMEGGKPVSSRMRLSRFFNSAPPPVRTMPRSLMSAESSGGVRSRATRTALRMVATHSLKASRISLSSMVTVRGTPSIRLRPFTSMVSGFSSGYADPTRVDDAAHGDDRNVGRAAADVHHHVARRLFDRQPGANRRSHGLFDEKNLAGARAISGVLHCALFHRRNLAGNADDNSRMHKHAAVVRLLDEIGQH